MIRKTAALVILALAGSAGGLFGSDAVIGKPAPAFTLTDTHGVQRSLSDYRGKIVVLEWTNHGCPFVHKHYSSGNMQALQKKYAADGVVWLSICSSAPGKQGYYQPAKYNEIMQKEGADPTAFLLDPTGKVGHLYGATNTPQMYVINKDGTLVYMGGIDSIASTDVSDIPRAENYVAAALNETLAGKPVATPVSRPYGCSVKYAH